MGDEAKPKDGWDKVAIAGQLLSALILPFALLAAGYFVSEAAALREQLRREAERRADEDRMRLDRANALLESLASDNDRKRRVAVEWAKYLDRIKQLPPEAVAVLLELALTDEDPGVARAASAVAAEVAVGDAAIRGFAAARLKADPSLRGRVDQIARVIDIPVAQVEGEATIPPCRAGSGVPFGRRGDCDRDSATVVQVCTDSFPRAATTRATRVFTKWLGDPRPWEQAEAAVGREGDWNVFESTTEENVGTDQKRICTAFRHWSSHQARTARIQVTYAR